MATKSKSIKTNKTVKVVALILAVLMFFTSGFFASMFVKSFLYYFDGGTDDFYRTQSFRSQMNDCINDVIYSAEYITVKSLDDFRKTADGKRITEEHDKQVLEVTQAHDVLSKSNICVYRDAQNRYRYSLVYDGVLYYFLYDGQTIDENEFSGYDYISYEADNNREPEYVHDVYNPYETGSVPAYVGDIQRALSIIFGVDNSTCYGEVGKDTFTQILKSYYEDQMRFTYEYKTSSKNRIENIKSINYAVILKTGAVVTNCGITTEDNREQIIKKLTDDKGFAEGVKDGKYEIYKGKEATDGKSVFTFLRKEILNSYYEESVLKNNTQLGDEGISAAYFGVPAKKTGISELTISEQAYENYCKHLFVSPMTMLAFAIITFLIACAACIYLIAAAGKTENGIKLRFVDKIPAEINWVIGIAAMAALAAAQVFVLIAEFEVDSLYFYVGEENREMLIRFIGNIIPIICPTVAACFSGFFMLWTSLNMSIARNIRNKTFFKHTICYYIFKPVRIFAKFLIRKIKELIEKLKYVFDCDYSKGHGTKFKIISCVSVLLFGLATAIYYFVIGVIMANGSGGLALILLFFGFIGDLAALLFAGLVIVSADRIFEAVSDIGKGNMNRTIDTKFMPPFMERFSKDILSMRNGLQTAVEGAVKDQRMKAELITNVSHDLKTPLTSIVTYVDLLKKCNIEGEEANKYVSILDEKAQKMKKLIEDLVEASKASTGAVELHPIKINLCEFAAQAVGEHEDELRNKNIELLLKMPETPVIVTADSQKTSRIIENLFSNIRKYAMEGTRTYVEVLGGEEYGTIVFKNISKEQIEVTAEELTQRFVRGDSSRSSEGSGLGLSIAKSLCELQNGKLSIQIDGDLFKAMVVLPKA